MMMMVMMIFFIELPGNPIWVCYAVARLEENEEIYNFEPKAVTILCLR